MNNQSVYTTLYTIIHTHKNTKAPDPKPFNNSIDFIK